MTWTPGVPPRDLLREALSALLAHRLRATLSAVGIVFGIATVVTALAIGQGARKAALDEIGALGIDNLFVRAVAPGRGRAASRPPAPVLTTADARVIADTIPSARTVAAVRTARVAAQADGRHADALVAGVTSSWSEIARPALVAGRWLSEDDERARRRVAVIGGALSGELFRGGDPLGARVEAGGNWYAVIGVVAERAAGSARPALASVDTDRALLVPLATMDVSLGEGDGLDRVQEIGVATAGASAVELAAPVVAGILARRHPGGGYELVVPRELLAARLRARRTFDAVLVGIGGLALLISGIGIMNVMLAGVAERTQEIGVRRAFGARRADVVAQFAMEAAALCAAGGLVGVPLGALFSAIVALVAGWPVSLSPWAIVAALALATGVGLVFGIYPARLAANIEPVDALRAQ